MTATNSSNPSIPVRLFSDLHLEFYPNAAVLWKYLETEMNCTFDELKMSEDEVLCLCGDVGYPVDSNNQPSEKYRDLLKLFKNHWKTAVVINGNHEYYTRHSYPGNKLSMQEIDNIARQICLEEGIHFLQKESLVLNVKNHKIRFLGCVLWSKSTYLDFKRTNDSGTFNKHSDALVLHDLNKTWLTRELTSPKGYEDFDATVVLTHHLPLFELVNPRYCGMVSDDGSLEQKEHESFIDYKTGNTAYASDLSDIIKKASLNESNLIAWLFGHSHHQAETRKYGVQFMINALGYPNAAMTSKVRRDVFEVKVKKKSQVKENNLEKIDISTI